MKLDVYDIKNKKVGETEVPARLFDAKWNPDLVHQALLAQRASSREKVAHAKGRGEVRGGGKKPWRQKGTGRARHGSIRSPLWRGGGVTFGPQKTRVFAQKINKKMNQRAIFSALSKKLSDGEVKMIENLAPVEPKTKLIRNAIHVLFGDKTSVLLIPSRAKRDIHRATANIKSADAISPLSLNVYDILRHKHIMIEKDAVLEIDRHFTHL